MREGDTILKKTVNASNIKKFYLLTIPNKTATEKVHSTPAMPEATPQGHVKSPQANLPKAQIPENIWEPDLNLTSDDKDILPTDGLWLTDTHADATKTLVS